MRGCDQTIGYRVIRCHGHDTTETWCKDLGINLQVTAPYLPAQNGVSERFNRTLMELTQAMQLDANLPEAWHDTISSMDGRKAPCWTFATIWHVHLDLE